MFFAPYSLGAFTVKNFRCARLILCLLGALIPAGSWCATYPNRVWHTGSDGKPYYTVEDVTLNTVHWTAAESPVVCEGSVTVAAGHTLTIDPTVEVSFVEIKGLYVNGTLLATQASFNISGAPTAKWNGIYLSPDAGNSRLENCQITNSGGAGYCYYGCRGIGTYHGADRYAAVYIDGCSPVITGCTFTDTYGNAIEIWEGAPTISNCTFTNVGNDQAAIRFDNPYIFATITGNSGSGTGTIGVLIPGGTIGATGAWTVNSAGFPYIVNGKLTVAAGKTLTIPAGTTIQFPKGDTGLYIEGTLDAQGTAALPIVFKSRAAAPAKGDWNGIYLGPGAGGSVLKYAQVHHASGLGYCYYGCRGLGTYNGADRYAAVYVDNCSPSITNCLFANGYGNGIEVYQGKPVIQDNTFQDFGAEYYTIVLDTMDTFPIMSGNSVSGTGYQGVKVAGGSVSTNGVWPNPGAGFAYFIPGSVTIPEGKTLTIAKGITAYVTKGNVGVYVYGTLLALGTPAERITFTSWTGTPKEGDWNGVYVAPTGGASELRHVSIHYSGGLGSCYYGCSGLINVHGGAKYAALYVDDSDPVLENVAVSNTYGNGLEMWGASPTVNGIVFTDIRQNALRLEGGSAPSLSGMTFTRAGNTDWVVSMDGSCRPTIQPATFTDNGYTGIEVRAGTSTGDAAWPLWAAGVPYVVTGTPTVSEGHKLTVSPGVEMQFYRCKLYVYGTLLAEGTRELPITFTGHSSSPAPGDWFGIYLGPQAGASRMTWCDVSNGGRWDYSNGLIVVYGVGHNTMLMADSCAPTLSNISVRNSYHDGLELWASAAQVRNSVFTGNRQSGIAAKTGSTGVLTNISLAKNSTGIYVDNSSPVVRNSISAFNGRGFDGTGSATPSVSYSNVFGNSAANYKVVPDATGTNGNVSVDPMFYNVEAFNLRLLAGSPCVDAGDDSVVHVNEKDLDGRDRKIGNHVDMGAFELSGLPLYNVSDVSTALKILSGFQKATAADMTKLNLEKTGTSQDSLDLRDALRLMRKVGGADGNP